MAVTINNIRYHGVWESNGKYWVFDDPMTHHTDFVKTDNYVVDYYPDHLCDMDDCIVDEECWDETRYVEVEYCPD